METATAQDLNQFTGPDFIEPEVSFRLEEAKGESVGGKGVLGKVLGTFFVPNGVSRNNRFYPESLWSKVLEDTIVKKRLSERRMFGTISHEQPIDDKALLEGKISHIVTALSIKDGKQGFGEALILDTPAGRILKTILDAGAKLFVSSRASGAFKGEERGVPRVDPDSYQLNTFDFVLDPGFIQANPKLESLAESLTKLHTEIKEIKNNKNPNPNNFKGEPNMELVEKLSKENSKLEKDLETATNEVTRLTDESTVLTDENNSLKEEMTNYKAIVEENARFKALGSVEEIEKAFESAEGQHETVVAFKESVGSLEEAEEAIDKATDLVSEYKELGTPAEIDEALSVAETTIDEYKEFGTPEEVKQVFEKTETIVSNMKEEKDEKAIKKLATELKVSDEKVAILFKKGMTTDEIKSVLGDVKEVKPEEAKTPKSGKTIQERLTRKTDNLNENSKGDPVNEDGTPRKKRIFEKTRSERLMESLT